MLFDKYSLKSSECLFVTNTLGDLIEARKVNNKFIKASF